MTPKSMDGEVRALYGEPPLDHPIARLRHVLHVFEHEPDDREILTATRNAYADRYWTGLTMGDLRGLLEEFDAE